MVGIKLNYNNLYRNTNFWSKLVLYNKQKLRVTKIRLTANHNFEQNLNDKNVWTRWVIILGRTAKQIFDQKLIIKNN